MITVMLTRTGLNRHLVDTLTGRGLCGCRADVRTTRRVEKWHGKIRARYGDCKMCASLLRTGWPS